MNLNERIDIVYNKFTNFNNNSSDIPYGTKPIILQKQIWSDFNKIPTTNPLKSIQSNEEYNSIIKKYYKHPLTHINGFYAFYDENIKNIIDSNLGFNDYNFTLYAKDRFGNYTQEIPLNSKNFYLDKETGILIFPNNEYHRNISNLNPPAITCYCYIGNIGYNVSTSIQGDKGFQGNMGFQGNVGLINDLNITYTNDYNNSIIYKKNHLLFHNNSWFISNISNINSEPPSPHWNYFGNSTHGLEYKNLPNIIYSINSNENDNITFFNNINDALYSLSNNSSLHILPYEHEYNNSYNYNIDNKKNILFIKSPSILYNSISNIGLYLNNGELHIIGDDKKNCIIDIPLYVNGVSKLIIKNVTLKKTIEIIPSSTVDFSKIYIDNCIIDCNIDIISASLHINNSIIKKTLFVSETSNLYINNTTFNQYQSSSNIGIIIKNVHPLPYIIRDYSIYLNNILFKTNNESILINEDVNINLLNIFLSKCRFDSPILSINEYSIKNNTADTIIINSIGVNIFDNSIDPTINIVGYPIYQNSSLIRTVDI